MIWRTSSIGEEMMKMVITRLDMLEVHTEDNHVHTDVEMQDNMGDMDMQDDIEMSLDMNMYVDMEVENGWKTEDGEAGMMYLKIDFFSRNLSSSRNVRLQII